MAVSRSRPSRSWAHRRASGPCDTTSVTVALLQTTRRLRGPGCEDLRRARGVAILTDCTRTASKFCASMRWRASASVRFLTRRAHRAMGTSRPARHARATADKHGHHRASRAQPTATAAGGGRPWPAVAAYRSRSAGPTAPSRCGSRRWIDASAPPRGPPAWADRCRPRGDRPAWSDRDRTRRRRRRPPRRAAAAWARQLARRRSSSIGRERGGVGPLGGVGPRPRLARPAPAPRASRARRARCRRGAMSVAIVVSAANGTSPVTASTSTRASAYTSARPSRLAPCACSGDA